MRRRRKTPDLDLGLVVVGIDPSLQSTGICVIPSDWRVGSWDLQFAQAGHPLKKGCTEIETAGRVDSIVSRVLDIVAIANSKQNQVHVFIEDYAFGLGNSSAASQLHELGGCIKFAVRREFKRVVMPVGNAQWRKILIGKGSGKGIKDEVFRQLQMASDELFESTDTADAFGVANFGRSELGLSFLTLI